MSSERKTAVTIVDLTSIEHYDPPPALSRREEAADDASPSPARPNSTIAKPTSPQPSVSPGRRNSNSTVTSPLSPPRVKSATEELHEMQLTSPYIQRSRHVTSAQHSFDQQVVDKLMVLSPHAVKEQVRAYNDEDNMEQFKKFCVRAKLKREYCTQVDTMDKLDSALGAIKCCLKFTITSASYLNLLSRRLLRCTRIVQNFCRKSFVVHRAKKQRLLDQWKSHENTARGKIRTEVEYWEVRSKTSGSNRVIEEMWEVYMRCWLSKEDMESAIDNCWVERRNTYIHKFRDFKRKKLDGVQHGVHDTATKRKQTELSLWANFPPMHFASAQITIAELVAHHELLCQRRLATSINKTNAAHGKALKKFGLTVGDPSKIPSPVSLYHILLTFERKKLYLVIFLHQLAQSGHVRLPPAPTPLMRDLAAEAKNTHRRWLMKDAVSDELHKNSLLHSKKRTSRVYDSDGQPVGQMQLMREECERNPDRAPMARIKSPALESSHPPYGSPSPARWRSPSASSSGFNIGSPWEDTSKVDMRRFASPAGLRSPSFGWSPGRQAGDRGGMSFSSPSIRSPMSPMGDFGFDTGAELPPAAVGVTSSSPRRAPAAYRRGESPAARSPQRQYAATTPVPPAAAKPRDHQQVGPSAGVRKPAVPITSGKRRSSVSVAVGTADPPLQGKKLKMAGSRMVVDMDKAEQHWHETLGSRTLRRPQSAKQVKAHQPSIGSLFRDRRKSTTGGGELKRIKQMVTPPGGSRSGSVSPSSFNPRTAEDGVQKAETAEKSTSCTTDHNCPAENFYREAVLGLVHADSVVQKKQQDAKKGANHRIWEHLRVDPDEQKKKKALEERKKRIASLRPTLARKAMATLRPVVPTSPPTPAAPKGAPRPNSARVARVSASATVAAASEPRPTSARGPATSTLSTIADEKVATQQLRGLGGPLSSGGPMLVSRSLTANPEHQWTKVQ